MKQENPLQPTINTAKGVTSGNSTRTRQDELCVLVERLPLLLERARRIYYLLDNEPVPELSSKKTEEHPPTPAALIPAIHYSTAGIDTFYCDMQNVLAEIEEKLQL